MSNAKWQAATGRQDGRNLILMLAVSTVVFALVNMTAGFLTGWIQQIPVKATPLTGLLVLFNPFAPAAIFEAPDMLVPLFWVIAVMLSIIVTVASWYGWRGARSLLGQGEVTLAKLPGVANRHEVSKAAGERHLKKQASVLRPTFEWTKPQDFGYSFGTCHRIPVWLTVEDSMILLGPPRSGKGYRVLIKAILDAPGCVVTTSTRPDNLMVTMKARATGGRPVAVFDPQRLTEGLEGGMRWSPVRGCEDPQTAMIRAKGFAASSGLGGGGTENGGFWLGLTESVVRCFLHAAALGDLGAKELYRWATDHRSAFEAVQILQSHPGAAAGWGDELDSSLSQDPRTRDSIWIGVKQAFAALADPRVLDAVTPEVGEEFDPESFIKQRGTIYMLATGAGAGASAALVAAFIEDLVEVARRLAARSEGSRLDPPMALILDEIGNLAPLPSLPTLLAEGGGTGITTLAVFQSLSQARDKWGVQAAAAMWSSAIAKIILGGSSDKDDLSDLSVLIGDRDEVTESLSQSGQGDRSLSTSLRRLPILSPEQIRTLPPGTGVLMLRSSKPIILSMPGWSEREDGEQLAADKTTLERRINVLARGTV